VATAGSNKATLSRRTGKAAERRAASALFHAGGVKSACARSCESPGRAGKLGICDLRSTIKRCAHAEESSPFRKRKPLRTLEMAPRAAGTTPNDAGGACHVRSHPMALAPHGSRRQRRGDRVSRPQYRASSRLTLDPLWRRPHAAWRYKANPDRPLPTGRACVMRSAASPSPDACSGGWSAVGKTCRRCAGWSRGPAESRWDPGNACRVVETWAAKSAPPGRSRRVSSEGSFGFFGATAPQSYRRGVVAPSASRENQRRATCRLR
jgi:hypothetical protein